ncbi:hypothetical protein D9M68_877430 [compost metagenome]
MVSPSRLRPRYMPPRATSQTTAVCETVAARPNRTACFRVPRTATMKAAIRVLECPGSRPCKAPRRTALGKYSQAWAGPCCSNSAKLDMTPLEEMRGMRSGSSRFSLDPFAHRVQVACASISGAYRAID